MPAVETRRLSKRYGSSAEALRDLDLEVHEGEAFGLLGPNGAGKTTTIHCLLDFIRPTRGCAAIFGRPVTDPAVRARIGYLPESVALHDYYRGGALLEFYAGLLGLPSASRQRRVAEVLELLDLQEVAGERVSHYSKGMRQRLGFAQALLHDPDLLILDEPTSSLDPLARRQFSDILRDCKRRGKTILISSHILSELERLCDRVAILKDGALVRSGTLQELSVNRAVKLHVAQLPASAIEALVAAGAEVTIGSGSTAVHCTDERVRPRAEEVLARYGVAVERVEAERSSLEDVFLASVNGGDAA